MILVCLFGTSGEWWTAAQDLWVFLIAPFLGSALAAVLYPFWFANDNFTVVGKKDKVEATGAPYSPGHE